MELELVYNEETQEWEQKPEPFITIECETEEDFNFIGTAVAFYKKHIEKQEKPQTNADRIRAMSDEELLEILTFIADGGVYSIFCKNPKWTVVCSGKCKKCIAEWLKQPAEGDEGCPFCDSGK